VANAELAPYATYDIGLTTNRETGREQDASMSVNMKVSGEARSTHGTTLTNLMQSMKANAANMPMPSK
jgi:hypothetical protein